MAADLSRSRALSLSVTDTTDGAEVATTLADDNSLPTTLGLQWLLWLLAKLFDVVVVLPLLLEQNEALALELLLLLPPIRLTVGALADETTTTTGMISTDDDVLVEGNPTDSQDTDVVVVVETVEIAETTVEAVDDDDDDEDDDVVGVASCVSGFDLTSDGVLLPTVSSSDSTVQFDLRFRSRPLMTLDGLRITLPVNKRRIERKISHPIRLLLPQPTLVPLQLSTS